MSYSSKVRTCLWFDDQGEQAAEFYTSLLPESAIESSFSPTPDGPPLIVEFTLAGAPYMILNGGPRFTHTGAASISVLTDDQAETDRLWSALLADGGQGGRCGWLTDRFGVSWQVVPKALPELLQSEDKTVAKRAMDASMTMERIDIEALRSACRTGHDSVAAR